MDYTYIPVLGKNFFLERACLQIFSTKGEIGSIMCIILQIKKIFLLFY